MTGNILADRVVDENIIKFYYLNYTPEELVNKLENIKLEPCRTCSEVPFNAQVKGYKGALDEDGELWVTKETSINEAVFHKLGELSYILDFLMGTLASPTILTKINDKYYRASKAILNAVQISSYNYLENPYKKMIAEDLVNRWLQFDEDRNPNNYMVIHNSKNTPFVVAIDYDKSDLESEDMKITGNDEKFGWFRKEKTRFLTLLKPENFEKLYIDDFEERLKLMMAMDLEFIGKTSDRILSGLTTESKVKADIIKSNISKRREYINNYIRKWFKERDLTINDPSESDYSKMGKSFMGIYNNKS